MLCGEFRRAPIGLHLNSVFLSSANPSPYCALLTLVRGMAAITAPPVHDEEDIFLENGLLSYENPNYHLGPSSNRRLDDALNSNTDAIVYEDIYRELDDICNMGRGVKGGGGEGNQQASRKAYASLDVGSMGVDVNAGPLTQRYVDNRSLCEQRVTSKEDENGIQHIVGSITNDLYAVPTKKCGPKSPQQIEESSSPEKEWNSQNELPPGWEKHEDNDGPYYWHIKSGTIQRETPLLDEKAEKTESKCNLRDGDLISSFETSMSVTRSCTSSALDLDGEDRKRREEVALK